MTIIDTLPAPPDDQHGRIDHLSEGPDTINSLDAFQGTFDQELYTNGTVAEQAASLFMTNSVEIPTMNSRPTLSPTTAPTYANNRYVGMDNNDRTSVEDPVR